MSHGERFFRIKIFLKEFKGQFETYLIKELIKE